MMTSSALRDCFVFVYLGRLDWFIWYLVDICFLNGNIYLLRVF